MGIKALSIHGRTRKQLYKGQADWRPIAAVKHNPRMCIPIFGNGDVNSPERVVEMRDRYGLDGAMIGRASIGNPWFFKAVKHFMQTGARCEEPTLAERVEAVRKHLRWSVAWKGEHIAILEMRRHYANYFKGIPGFKPYRVRLVTAPSLEAVSEILEGITRISAQDRLAQMRLP